MKPKYIIGIAAALVLVVTAVMSVESSKIEYMSVAAARESGRTANLSGTWVKAKGHEYDAAANEFRFTLADSTGAEMPVILHGAKPNNFELSESVVATGQVDGNTFHATNVLTKCPSKYDDGGEGVMTY